MSKYGMASREGNYVNLKGLPDAKTERVLTFRNLTGGMNTFDLDFELKGSESPLIRNLSWHDGVLCARRGQVQVGNLGSSGVRCCYERLWHGWIIAHAGDSLYAWKARIESDPESECPVGTVCCMVSGLQDVAGSFALTGGCDPEDAHDEYLFYKTRGSFHRLAYNGGKKPAAVFACRPLVDYPGVTYVPVVQINTDPGTGAGDLYQPENRLSSYHRVRYSTPANTTLFKLPVSGAVPVKVTANGRELTRGVSWHILALNHDFVELDTAPAPGSNNVEILCRLRNDDAFQSVMSCTKLTVFGGAQDLCLVLGGSEKQPNAYFWSGNDSLGMNPTYFPASQYNLAGDAPEAITGFGKQQNLLVIFQPHSVGRAVFGTAEVSGRDQITLDYTPINAGIGCDLPRTIQLIENNLVWCSRRDGVCFLRDSSAAYENNILRISRKVDGDVRQAGLRSLVRTAESERVWSADTGTKYLVGYDGEAYEWNYSLSTWQNPSWFSHTGIQGAAFVADLQRLWELTPTGAVAEFQRVFSDFGLGIDKVYVLPPRNFGSYDRLKNVRSMLFTTRGDRHTNTQIEYTCDYGSRMDPTPLVSRSLWQLSPRDLSYRDLGCEAFAHVARRRPGYHNVRHLRVKLFNNEAGADLSLVSAQIFYTFRARQP